MLKALLLPLMNLALAAMATAQNLVPNPSFEDTMSCEASMQCDLLRAEHWRNPNTATPDVFDCDLARQCGMIMDTTSANCLFQGCQAALDGSRLAGGYQWYGPGSSFTKEYLMAQLTQPMSFGQAYEVSLYYSRCDHYMYAVDRISVYFGADSVFENHPNHLSVTPQVALTDPNEPYLVESAAWVQLTDTFVAQGGEEWMVIGTFLGPDDVNGSVVDASSLSSYAFYFFDQISVRPVGEVNSIDELLAFADPNGTVMLSWIGPGSLDHIRVCDMEGRTLYDRSGTWGHERSIQLDADLPGGVYIVVAMSQGRRQVARFIKGE